MKFNYQARTKDGSVHFGIVEASSREAALKLLQKYDFYVTFLEEVEKQSWFSKKIKLFSKISKRDIVIFSRQLAIMLNSKVPLVEALRVLVSQTENPNLSEKILKIAEEVEGGTLLSKAFSRYPEIFSTLYISMIKSGEASGKLSESLDYVAQHLERDYYLRSKIKGVMIYPIFILFVLTSVFSAMMVWVVPNIKNVLKQSQQELPLVTKFTIALSDFIIQQGIYLIIIFIIFAVSVFLFLKSKKGKEFFGVYSLQVPGINVLLKKIYLTRFAENLSTLIKAGLPINQALEITGDVVGNIVYKEIISEAKKSVTKGEAISSVLMRFPKNIPPLFVQMVQTGERSGRLDNALINVAEFYRKETEVTINNLASIIEPVLIIFLGLMVAFLAVAILIPVYKTAMSVG